MSRSDTCNLTLRIHSVHQPAAIAAFGTEPAERHDLPDRLCVLVFDDIEPHVPLDDLARQHITFDGSHDDGTSYSGRLFAAEGGELAAIDQPFGVVSVPVDLDSLAVDEAALSDLRAYQRLRARTQQDFDHQPPLEIPLTACHLKEAGDPQQPWHRLLGAISIGGLHCQVEAVAVRSTQDERRTQEAVGIDSILSLTLVSTAFGAGRGFQTLRLKGSDGQDRDYALFIYPHHR